MLNFRFPRRLFTGFALAALIPSNGIVRAGELGKESCVGAARQPSRIHVRYQYFFDRNALRDARLINGALIALTDSGNLLRFDERTLGLTREWYGSSAITCLGRGRNGAVLAGFQDGRVCLIDPTSLIPTELAHVPGKPQWVGETGEGAGPGRVFKLLAVFESTSRNVNVGRRSRAARSAVYRAGDPAHYDLEGRASAFFLDSGGRLWIGADNGEWLGWCAYFDPRKGAVHSVPGLKIYHDVERLYWRGVIGFAELHDGQVWAFGGLIHVRHSEGFIWRVDSGAAKELYYGSNTPVDIGEDRPERAHETKLATGDQVARGRSDSPRTFPPVAGAETIQVSDAIVEPQRPSRPRSRPTDADNGNP